jgi:biotin transport system substrate-specific component
MHINQGGGFMYPSHTRTSILDLSLTGKDRTISFIHHILFTLLFTSITGLCAKIRIYLPFTPVPVTGQVYAVLLSGLILGKEYGSLSQLFYILLGLMGVPWFVIGPVGPTAGYLVGFILAPWIIGFIREKAQIVNMKTTLLSLISGIFVIYLFGTVHFSIFTQTKILPSVMLAVLPFIPFDILKAVFAAMTAYFLFRE